MDRLTEVHARRVAEAAATMPAFAAACAWTPLPPADLLRRVVAALGGRSAVWRDGAAVAVDRPAVAVALPGPVFPVLAPGADWEALRDRAPESFTAAEVSGATFTVWGLGSDVEWLTPPLLPRQTGGLGVGRAGLTLVADARATTPWDAERLLADLHA